ncbi:glucosamine-6-phosphate deaminase [Erwiniaceae bacterium BAC15a-03b]|uniref:Glucosamine-6-phosphate deaminase n=1 Tax=Winslowiella arboricola TaxID=2978220 RepID=A0A9J6PKL6_9GAMM|nr:glucosamine-6-phosphate deaminase [Winslowiella arboricola]MCU5774056.1 glucosamine-6-phosphate deaminase [Winslowiella arboricola]MCU5777011.1 glucosamine-6-phosphate deaminase [Winslowiella arboricola]
MKTTVQRHQVDLLQVEVCADRQAMGAQAAEQAAAHLRQLLATQSEVRIIFAAAPSQNEFLDQLARAADIDWSRVTAFHMDEYIGLSEQAPQRFSHYLEQHIFQLVKPGKVFLIPSSGDPLAICADYAGLIQQAPIDMVCLGIGENGHLAFNDPPVADFADLQWMKAVELDEICRQQQVNDGCFPTLETVPRFALTLTIPALMAARRLFCMVPGANKRRAVSATLYDPISAACPATVLRRHPQCTLYTDQAAFQERMHG